MDGVSLKSRAVVFALCTGAVAFFLALLVTTGALGWSNYARALISCDRLRCDVLGIG